MPAFLTPDSCDAWLTPERLTGERKVETLSMLEYTSDDVAASIIEHIVERKGNNSRTADARDSTLIAAAAS